MLLEYKKKTIIGIVLTIVTFVLAVLARCSSESQTMSVVVAYVLLASVLPLWLLSMWCYAKGKGYHGAWGLFLGIGHIIGLIILACLPDKHKLADKSCD